ncbi:uncharacterized protein PFLUO_LOCUS766 [Penicillium psychrofluorescens]|uniref:uncharacterized protein n=1 Tax=Penicillium psychrofluorescens TaxID=3158075 RepID=UPI003CCCFE43
MYTHLPTPKGRRTWLWGNLEPHFAEPAGMAARRIAESTPNDGLLRYYGFLSQERIMLTTPQYFSEVLVQKGYEYPKSFLLKYAISRVTGEGLGYTEGDLHRRQRKNLMPAFSYRHIKDLYPAFWRKGQEMADRLTPFAASGAPVTIREWASRVTLDIMGETGMALDFGSLHDPDNALVSVYKRMLAPPPPNFRYFAQLGNFVNPALLQRLPLPRNRMIAEGAAYLRGVTRDIIARKREVLAEGSDNGDVDIVGVALRSGGFDDEDLVSHMMTFLAAGHETTSTAFQWLIWVLCKHPEVQARLREEVRRELGAFFSSSSSPASTSSPDAAAVDALPYLKAVCNEVLRHHPPTPMTTREAMSDGRVGDTFVPRGTTLVVPSEATNHDPTLWGPDAAAFNPDRWMAPGQANSGGARSNYAMMTFIHGPRSCIGANFTRSELACLAAVFVGRFVVELVDPEQPLEYDNSVTVAPKGGVQVKIRSV